MDGDSLPDNVEELLTWNKKKFKEILEKVRLSVQS